MRRLLGVLVLATLVPLGLVAQDDFQPSKIEVFGGYQFMHAGNFDGLGDSANTSGYTGSATFNFTKRMGVAADFSDNYKLQHLNPVGGPGSFPAHVHIYTYTFGPVVHLVSTKNFSVFAHALFGGAVVRPTGCVIFSGSPNECGSGNASGFAMMVGGGVDTRVGKLAALRLAQVDWVRLPSEFGAQNANMRFSTGIVFRF